MVGDLKFARNSAVDGTGLWTITTVDTGGTANVGRYNSLALTTTGLPIVSYYDVTNGDVKFARNSAPDGSGSWTITVVDNGGSAVVGEDTSLVIMPNGRPAISYRDTTNNMLKLARNSAADGSGAWTITTVDNAVASQLSSLAIVNGHPAVSYQSILVGVGGPYLKFARNTLADGSGTWTIAAIIRPPPGFVGAVAQSSLAILSNGNPAIAYAGFDGPLHVLRNSAADGSGPWSSSAVQGAGGAGLSHAIMANGRPALAHYGAGLQITRNSAADASGIWLPTAPDASGNGAISTSAVVLTNGRLGISYHTRPENDNGDLKWATVDFPADIAVEQPVGTNITTGGTRDFGTLAVDDSASVVFTLKNVGDEQLTAVAASTVGASASEFTISSHPSSAVAGPTGSTTFTTRFAPASSGIKTAVIRIASDDADENPFEINVTGRGLSYTEDSDGDGLNDASELKMALQGFNWQTSQPELVASLFDNANGAGLYTESQVQALHIDTPLIRREAGGEFTLTIGVRRSTDLQNFDPFPMSAPQTVINAQGELEFRFTVPDNAAFFRLEAR
jgi:hypothetical protein